MMREGAIRSVVPPTVGVGAFVATFGTALLLIVLFLALDVELARIDRRENARHAANLYDEGRALLATGNASGARERFASAAATDRANTTYVLGLAQALLAEGRAREAEETLNTLLDRAGNSGAVNLVMARLLVQAGRPREATAYFHRAIFGRWGADSASRRIEARFELIALLEAHHDEQAMLAELLPLQAAFPDSAALQRRLAHLYIRAGAPSRGVAVLREMVRADPLDGEAYAGLGEAALALGNFMTAHADLVQAARLRPHDPRLDARLALADTILALDPERRGLSAEERVSRAKMVLERSLSERARCGGRATSALADSARAALAGGGRRPSTSSDQLVGMALAIAPASGVRCRDGSRPDEVLLLLLRALDR